MRLQRLGRVLLAALVIAAAAGGVGAQKEAPAAKVEEALAAVQAGQVREARALFEEVVAEWPNHRLARYHLGRMALERGELESAGTHLEIATSGEFPRVFSAWYLLGRYRLLERSFEGAMVAFDEALRRAPRFAPARLGLAEALLFQSRTDEGMADLGLAGEHSGVALQAGLLKSQLLLVLDREEEARSLLENLPTGGGAETERWRREAGLLRTALGPSEQAESELARGFDDNANLSGVYWALAMARLRGGDRAGARRLFRVALDADSENPVTLLFIERLTEDSVAVALPAALPNLDLRLARAHALWQEGRPNEAAQIAADLVVRRPLLVSARLVLIRDAERRGDLWWALAEYQRLIEWLGSVPSLEAGLAGVAQTLGASEMAACSARRAIAMSPEDASLRYLLAAIEADRGRTEAAVEACRRAVELGYGDVRVWLKLGELYFEQMRISESLEAYQRAMEVDPQAAEAVRPFALSSLTTQQHESLRRLLEKHIEANPDNSSTLYSLGVMSLRENRLDQAKSYFLRLAEVAPDHRQVHYNLGQIYLRQGDREAGQAEMERFRELKAAENEEWERHNQAHFRRLEAQAAVEEGRIERAIELYGESVEDGTAEMSDHLELAAALHLDGRSEEALARYDRILGWNPYHREALEGVLKVATALVLDERVDDARRKLEILDWPCELEADP